MKKSIILLSGGILSIGLLAFSYVNWNTNDNTCEVSTKDKKTEKKEANYYLETKTNKKIDADFFYDLGSRFRGIKRSDIQNASTVADFLSQDQRDKVGNYYSVNVIIIKQDEKTDIREKGFSDKLTADQVKLLRSLDYSTNFLVEANFIEKNKELKDAYSSFTPYMTVVPEKQAEYKQGKEVLLAKLDIENKKNTFNLDRKKLQPAKLYFTVTKIGTIEKLNLDRSCGYSTIDIEMIELITNSSGKWIPAENTKGEKVDQELVLSFGLVGC